MHSSSSFDNLTLIQNEDVDLQLNDS